MAIEYVSHSFNFNPITSGLELFINLRAENTGTNPVTFTTTFSVLRRHSGSDYGKKEQTVSITVAPATVQNRQYKYCDYTAKPSELLTYIFKKDSEAARSFTTVFTHEDLLLSTGTQVLNIKYNPDISSVKITTGDAITQTLGSQYPYFRRNGIMNYKQFNIGGLISYHEDNAFFTTYQLGNLTEVDAERVKEKQFRDAVLDFLYDAKPKILKSTTEGCMIIKLTNISLTPNKQLGRSIYSFTAQATEYAAPSIDNLKTHGRDFVLEASGS